MNDSGRNARRPLRMVDGIGVLVIVLLALVSWRETSAWKQKAVSELEEQGARAYANDGRTIDAVVANGLRFSNSEAFRTLPRLGAIESLSLSRCVFDYEQLRHITQLHRLRSLSLYNTRVSDDQLEYVGQCSNLEVLSLDGTRVSSRGIEELSGLQQLKCLTLARTKVDDECIDALSMLTGLGDLDLRQTDISRRGLRRLRNLLPECSISHDFTRPQGRPFFHGPRQVGHMRGGGDALQSAESASL